MEHILTPIPSPVVPALVLTSSILSPIHVLVVILDAWYVRELWVTSVPSAMEIIQILWGLSPLTTCRLVKPLALLHAPVDNLQNPLSWITALVAVPSVWLAQEMPRIAQVANAPTISTFTKMLAFLLAPITHTHSVDNVWPNAPQGSKDQLELLPPV